LTSHADINHGGFDIIGGFWRFFGARNKDKFLKTGHASLDAPEKLHSEAGSGHGAVAFVNPKKSIIYRQTADNSQFFWIAHGHACLELGVCSHVAISGAEIEDIALGIEKNLARPTSEAKAKTVVF
jgi:hypothetical protein